MSKEEFVGKLQMCYVGDKNAFEEIVAVYDELQEIIKQYRSIIENIGNEKQIDW